MIVGAEFESASQTTMSSPVLVRANLPEQSHSPHQWNSRKG